MEIDEKDFIAPIIFHSYQRILKNRSRGVKKLISCVNPTSALG